MKNTDKGTPKDQFYIIYILFFFLGLAQLLPTTFISTATKFWMYKFRNTSLDSEDSEFRTELQAQFRATLNIVNHVTGVVSMILSLYFGKRIRLRVRFVGVMVLILVSFSIITAFVKTNTDSWQESFFALVMVIMGFMNAVNSIFAISNFKVLSYFPHHYLAPYITGTTLSSLVTSFLQILSLATNLGVEDSAMVYFSLGVFVIALTYVFVIVATGYNEFYLHTVKNYQRGKPEKQLGVRKGFHLLKKIWSCVAMLTLIMLQAEASPTALVVSVNEGSGIWNDVYFVPVVTFLMSSLFDIIGKWISFRFAPNLPGWLWALITAIKSVAFIGLYMLCNAQPRKHLPVVFSEDYEYITFICVSAILRGYLLGRSSYNLASLVTKEELEEAYHVNILCTCIITAAFSFVSVVSVDLL